MIGQSAWGCGAPGRSERGAAAGAVVKAGRLQGAGESGDEVVLCLGELWAYVQPCEPRQRPCAGWGAAHLSCRAA